MEYEEFIIDVPAGPSHQPFVNILKPIETMRPRRLWSISVPPSVIADQSLLSSIKCDGLGLVRVWSEQRPTIVIKGSNGPSMSVSETAEFLRHRFQDLHWAGLTPDGMIATVSKRLLVVPGNYTTPNGPELMLELLAVRMLEDEILDVLQTPLAKLANMFAEEESE